MIEIKKKRNTKQQFILVEYLKKHKSEHLTAEEIYNGLINQNISQATIYRLLSSLSKDGIIKKIHIDDTKPACYQYTEEKCKNSGHYHFICNKCSNMFHFEDETVNILKKSLQSNKNFLLDTDKTTFYGICNKCLKGENDE